MDALETSDTIALHKGLQHSQSDLATYRLPSVSSDEATASEARSTPSPDTFPSVRLPPIETGTLSQAEKYRRTSPHELTVGDKQWSQRRRKSSDTIIEPPQRRRSRRRASQVLHFALATSDKSMHVPSLLERYQVCSLACSSDLVSNPELLDLILNSPRNKEGKNYQLSQQMEP